MTNQTKAEISTSLKRQSESAKEAPKQPTKEPGRLMTFQATHLPPHCIDYMRLLVDTFSSMMDSIAGYCECDQGRAFSRNYASRYTSFVHAVFKKGRLTYSVVIIGLLYLARFRHALFNAFHQPSFILEREKRRSDFVPKIFLAALLISTKFLCDRHGTNAGWAKDHQLSLFEVNWSEALFLSVIKHDVNVSERSFNSWMTQVFSPDSVRQYAVISPPTPPYHLNDLYEQKIERRRRLGRVQ